MLGHGYWISELAPTYSLLSASVSCLHLVDALPARYHSQRRTLLDGGVLLYMCVRVQTDTGEWRE